MVGVQNADSGKALTIRANKLVPLGRKRTRGDERRDEFGFDLNCDLPIPF